MDVAHVVVHIQCIYDDRIWAQGLAVRLELFVFYQAQGGQSWPETPEL